MPMISGNEIEGSIERGIAKFSYDFSTQGGAISTINLRGDALPDNAIVYGGILDVITAPVGAGASVSVQINAANDLVTASAIAGAPWSTTGLKAIVPVATAATAIRLTAARYVTTSISAIALTAGKFNVFILYFESND